MVFSLISKLFGPIFVLVLLSGCMPTQAPTELAFKENVPRDSLKDKLPDSHALDESIVQASDHFSRAKIIMNATCFRCHGDWSDYTEQSFIENGLIDPGLPDSSSLIIRSKHSNAQGVAPMPPDNSPEERIYKVDYHEYLKAWVVNATDLRETGTPVLLTYAGAVSDGSKELMIMNRKAYAGDVVLPIQVKIKNNSQKSFSLSRPVMSNTQSTLEGLSKTTLAPGEEATVTFNMSTELGNKSTTFEVNTSLSSLAKIVISLSGAMTNPPLSPLDEALSQETDKYKRAKLIINAACVRCHTDYQTMPNEQAWIENGLIKPGKPDESLLIKRSKYSGSGMSQMPPKNSVENELYKEAYYQDLRAWVMVAKDMNAGTLLQFNYANKSSDGSLPLTVSGIKAIKGQVNAQIEVILKNNGLNTVNLSGPAMSSNQFTFVGFSQPLLTTGQETKITFKINDTSLGNKASTFTALTGIPLIPKITIKLSGEVNDPPMSQTDYQLSQTTDPFARAKIVMNATCFRCHGTWASFSEQDYIDNGLIVAGSPTTSTLIKMSKYTSGGTMPPATAPENGVYKVEYHNVLKDWVTVAKDITAGQAVALFSYRGQNSDAANVLKITGLLGTTDAVMDSLEVKIKNNSRRDINFTSPSMSSTQFTFLGLPKTKLAPNEEMVLKFKIDQTSVGAKASTFTATLDHYTLKKITINFAGEIKNNLNALGLQCDSSNKVSTFPVRRLTKSQYLESLRVILGSQANTVMNEVESSLATLPGDDNSLHYPTMDNKVTKAHTDAYYFIGRDIAKKIANNSTRLSALAGSCAVATSVTTQCRDNFIKNFGLKVYRRPITAEELSALQGIYNSESSSKFGFMSLIQTFLTSASFTNEIIVGGTLVSGDIYNLSAYELTARAYFTIVGHTPDDHGLSKAADGSVLTAAGYDALINYLYSLKDASGEYKVNKILAEFMRYWLEVKKLSSFSADSKALKHLAGSDLMAPANGTHQADGDISLTKYIEHHLFENNSHFSEFMTSNKVFAVSDTLKKIFKVPNKSSSVQLAPSAEARGLLLQPLFLYGGRAVAENDPFPRGNKLARNVLCKEIRFPTDLDAGSLEMPAFDHSKTTRERFEAKTSADACMACHKIINPLGFALEGFDVLGRYKNTQNIYSPTTLDFLNNLPVNDHVSVEFVPGMFQDVQGGFEFVKKVDESRVAHACFAKNVVHYTTGLNVTKDRYCAVQNIYNHLVANKPVRDVLRALVKDESFKKVKKAP